MAGMVLRGRSEPMATALGLLRRVIQTWQGCGLIVTGEAGIGKSALLSAVLREARHLGMVCGSVRADRVGRLVPGGPVLTALRDGPDPVLSADAFSPLELLRRRPVAALGRGDTCAGAGERGASHAHRGRRRAMAR